MQLPLDKDYYSRPLCRMVKNLGTIFEKSMNNHRYCLGGDTFRPSKAPNPREKDREKQKR